MPTKQNFIIKDGTIVNLLTGDNYYISIDILERIFMGKMLSSMRLGM